MIRKKYKLLISKPLPNGVIISQEFFTEMEEETEDGKALFNKVYKETCRDIKETMKRDPGVKNLYTSYIEGLKIEKELKESEEEFYSD